jgi:hypothetical protein
LGRGIFLPVQGVLNIDFEKLPSIQFYADTVQDAATKNLSVIKDRQGAYVIKNNMQVGAWFKPEGL